MIYIDDEDIIAYFEMAKIAMAYIPEDVVESMDMSDEELIRLRDQLDEYMHDDGSDDFITQKNADEKYGPLKG